MAEEQLEQEVKYLREMMQIEAGVKKSNENSLTVGNAKGLSKDQKN
jgi:hypothetical protein